MAYSLLSRIAMLRRTAPPRRRCRHPQAPCVAMSRVLAFDRPVTEAWSGRSSNGCLQAARCDYTRRCRPRIDFGRPTDSEGLPFSASGYRLYEPALHDFLKKLRMRCVLRFMTVRGIHLPVAPSSGPISVKALNAEGYVVLIFDYRGFGESEGPRCATHPAVGGESDVRAALTWAP